MKTERSDVRATLAQALEDFREGFAGVRPEYARIVVADQAIAAWLCEVLSPAERQMAGTGTGREMLERVGEWILEQARLRVLHLVEGNTLKDAILIDVHLDVVNGNQVGFFSSNEDLENAS